MKLMIIRHAIAEDREVFRKTKKPDNLRPLTQRGKKRMRQNLAGIIRLESRLDVLISSPLTRALQTTKIVNSRYKKSKIEVARELEPETSVETTLRWLKKYSKRKIVGVVGHEPHLSRFIAYCVNGHRSASMELKKGGICILDFPATLAPGSAELICLAQPSLLKLISRL